MVTDVIAEVFEWKVGTNYFLRPHHPELFHQSVQSRVNNFLQCQAELQTPKPVFNRHEEAEPNTDFLHRKKVVNFHLSIPLCGSSSLAQQAGH